jgi:hypothetical protein
MTLVVGTAADSKKLARSSSRAYAISEPGRQTVNTHSSMGCERYLPTGRLSHASLHSSA